MINIDGDYESLSWNVYRLSRRNPRFLLENGDGGRLPQGQYATTDCGH